jgi:hypothetical protein
MPAPANQDVRPRHASSVRRMGPCNNTRVRGLRSSRAASAVLRWRGGPQGWFGRACRSGNGGQRVVGRDTGDFPDFVGNRATLDISVCARNISVYTPIVSRWRIPDA